MALSGPGSSQAGLEPGEELQLPGGCEAGGAGGGGGPVKQMVRHQELIANGRSLNCPLKKEQRAVQLKTRLHTNDE